MSQNSEKNQKALIWLTREKTKDDKGLELDKKKIIQEIRKLQKTDLIQLPKKLSLWQRIKIILLGQ